MQVGMIGVGRMGKAMAHKLLKDGHHLHLFDTALDSLHELQSATIAASAKDAFAGDVVISMLPNDEAMRAVFVHGGVLPEGGSTTIHMNMAICRRRIFSTSSSPRCSTCRSIAAMPNRLPAAFANHRVSTWCSV